MKDYKKKYYEQKVFWNYDYLLNPPEKKRIHEIINIVPADAQSILDAGCGNGAFVNYLGIALPNRSCNAIGLDVSKEALKYVKTEKINGTITNLPFRDKSFDLVTCLEILEHLPQEDFKKGILELQRVSKKYIIITVPNEEDIEYSSVMCPKCYCWFNPCFHMRSFDKNTLCNLLNNFKSIKIKEIGPLYEYRSYNRLSPIFYRAWKKPLPPITAICPQCGYQRNEARPNIEDNNTNCPIIFKFLHLFKPLAKVFGPLKRKKRWLLSLYEKADE